MGTWGSGNFENDGAADFRDDFVASLFSRVEECLKDEEFSVEESGEDEFMPLVAMILILCRETSAYPPKPNQVISWRDQYIELFEEEFEDLEPNEGFESERRQVIEKTFHELLSISTEVHGET